MPAVRASTRAAQACCRGPYWARAVPAGSVGAGISDVRVGDGLIRLVRALRSPVARHEMACVRQSQFPHEVLLALGERFVSPLPPHSRFLSDPPEVSRHVMNYASRRSDTAAERSATRCTGQLERSDTAAASTSLPAPLTLSCRERVGGPFYPVRHHQPRDRQHSLTPVDSVGGNGELGMETACSGLQRPQATSRYTAFTC